MSRVTRCVAPDSRDDTRRNQQHRIADPKVRRAFPSDCHHPSSKMPPKATGGKSKAGAPDQAGSGATAAPRTIQTRSQKAGLQVCLSPPFFGRAYSRIQVSCRSYSSLSETTHTTQRADRCKSCSIYECDSRVPHSRGTRAGRCVKRPFFRAVSGAQVSLASRQRIKRSSCETYNATAFATGDSWRRGA